MRRLSNYGPSLIVLGTAMLVLFLGPSAVQRLTYKQTQARMIQASQRLERSTILQELNQAYQDIAALVEPSVVHISAQQLVRGPRGGPTQSLSTGSGWIYDEQGHVVTNYHVVKATERIDVQLSTGGLREASIVGFDESTDVAVLKIAPGHLHPAVRADATEVVQRGDLVFAFGSPFDFRFSMSSGIVSGKGRHVGVIRDDVGRSGYENFIQVDAAINPGNSGGPLTDYRGRVIGMNTAIATGRRTSLEEGQFAGIGLAIPLEMIEPVVDQLIEKGFVEKGYLGVNVRDLTSAYRQSLGFAGDGVRIMSVEEGGPAELAGVQADDIVTEVDGQTVESRTQLQSMISSVLPGEVVELTIWRSTQGAGESEVITLDVRLGRLDMLRARGKLDETQSRDRIPQVGIAKMTTSTPALAARFDAPFQPGVLVLEVVPGSELAEQIPEGTTITGVRGQTVTSVEELLRALNEHDLRWGVRISVLLPEGTTALAYLRVRD